jgi:lysophospholipase L1-like esterase
LARLEQALSDNEGIRVVAIGLGTNEFSPSKEYQEAYRENMSALIRAVQSHGKIAMLARIPWARGRDATTQEAMNRVVDALRQEFNLPEGPDLYAYFRENPQHLRDELHPNAEGQKAMNYLWAQAAMAAKAAGTLSKL